MGPDRDLLAQALGGEPRSWARVDTGGYTRAQAWRVETADGPVFVKQAEEAGPLEMLRTEGLVYREVRDSFLPAFAGFADSGERALLAIELLEHAVWPPPYPDDVSPLFDALAKVATTPPPTGLRRLQARTSRWRDVAADPEPFLGLGLCSPVWLDRSLDSLLDAEARATFEGSSFLHYDVYSGNVCFTDRGPVLVDWGMARVGAPQLDLALAVLSVRVEGAQLPAIDFPNEAAFAASFAGQLAFETPQPLPEWADPGSTLRADQAGDLAHALQWVAELLDLPPLS